MIYVEFISRRQGIALDDFHTVVRGVQEAWESAHGADQLILNAGRTWRLGPEPAYLGIWDTGESGLERLDDWTKAFRQRGKVGDEATMSRVARIDFAGCYRSLTLPVRAHGAYYYLEFFRPMGSDGGIRSLFHDRAARHTALRLHLVAIRMGRLAPDPGGIAVWSLPDFASLTPLAEEADNCGDTVQVTAAGLYADIGSEIL